MSIGLGIFLSSQVFALILLYLITRDRWNWHRIGRRLGVSALIVGCLIGLVVGGLYAWDRFANTVFKQTEYAGLHFGMTMAEIKYVKGFPTTVIDSRGKGWPEIVASTKLEHGKKIEDYNEWWYEDNEHSIDLEFYKDKLIVIKCFSKTKRANCPPLGGIFDGDSEQVLFYRFGQPSKSSIIGSTKTVEYPNVGAFFILEKETIYLLGIHDTNYKQSCDDDSCKWVRMTEGHGGS